MIRVILLLPAVGLSVIEGHLPGSRFRSPRSRGSRLAFLWQGQSWESAR